MATTPGKYVAALNQSPSRLFQSGNSVSLPKRPSLSRPRNPVLRRVNRKCIATPPTSTVTDTPIEAIEDSYATAKEFDWAKNWWPVQSVQNLDATRPNRIELLGRWFVAWMGPSNEWNVMDDMCPHRLAPLSEGRVESDGTLLCAYHAWRFDESGKCVKIPHADDEAAHCTACNSSQSRITKYPSKAYGNILWVWPDASPNAETESANAPIPMPDFVAKAEAAKGKLGIATYNRVLPYGYDILLENLLDPAHVPVSHHKVAPHLSRYAATPLGMTATDPFSDAGHANHPNVLGSFRFTSNATKEDGVERVEFVKPSFVRYHTEIAGGERWFGTILFAAPLAPGRSRLFIMAAYPGMVKPNGESGLPWLLKLMPWLAHHGHNTILDGDGVFLSMQEKQLEMSGNGRSNPLSQYYMPTSADKLVVLFRKWYGEEGKGGPEYPGGRQINLSELPREKLLDRMNQHTKDCVTCRNALKLFERVVATCSVLMCVAFFGLCGVAGSAGLKGVVSKLSGLGCLVVLAAAAWIRNLAQKERQKFIFVDWVHAEKH